MFSDRDYIRRPAGSGAPPRLPPLTMTTTLILVTVVVFIAQCVTPGHAVDGLLCLAVEPLRHGQVWRLLSYILVHGGFWHILFNMWALFMFGRMLEPHLGRWRLLALYLLSGLIGAGAWLLCNWTGTEPVVGASGSVCGIVMATAMLFPNARIMLLLPPVPLKLKTFVVVFAIVEVFSELAIHDNIAHIAHLGGLAGGFFIMQWHMPSYSLRNLFNWIHNPFRRKWKLHEKPAADRPLRAEPLEAGADSAEFMRNVDRVLDKIGREGINSLTPDERRTLERARERLRQK